MNNKKPLYIGLLILELVILGVCLFLVFGMIIDLSKGNYGYFLTQGDCIAVLVLSSIAALIDLLFVAVVGKKLILGRAI